MELFDQPQNNQCVTIIVFRALSFPTAVGFKDNLSLGQRLALVSDLPLDRDGFAGIRARVGAAAPAGREQNDGQNEPTGACAHQEPPSEIGKPGLVGKAGPSSFLIMESGIWGGQAAR